MRQTTDLTLREIAKKFGVSHNVVLDILQGKTYKNVK